MQYREEHQIEFSECDENQHLKLPSMVDLLMQVSEHQLDKGGAGTDDLMAQGKVGLLRSIILILKDCLRRLKKLL